MSKYNAQRVVIDGIAFDSKVEALRYGELKLLEQAEQIWYLKVHPVYELCPAFTDAEGTKHRRATYEGDFEYGESVTDYPLVCEDVKGFFTPMSKLKIKLAAYKYPGVRFRIVKV